MRYRTLGRTGLKVSLLSLGSGGPNQFGQSRYVAKAEIMNLVGSALDLGINLFDTASTYQHSESLLREAMRSVPRDRYLLATKIPPFNGGNYVTAAEMTRQVHQSLDRAGVNHFDLLQLHRVPAAHYQNVMDRLQPELEKLRSQGKVRYLGITESSVGDPGHEMLQMALRDDYFDTVMVAYHLGNPSAANSVIPLASEKNAGVIGMIAARHLVPRGHAQRLFLFVQSLVSLWTSPPSGKMFGKRLRRIAATLREGQVKRGIDLVREQDGSRLALPEAGYTFVASNPAVATVLTGTNSIRHLQQNVRAVMAPPLTAHEIDELIRIIG